MRKTVALLLASLLVFSCFVMTACSCAHEYNPKTGLCNKCGEACVHDFNEKGRCAICRTFCAHVDHDQTSMICNTCGKETLHTFENKVCTGCGKKTAFLDDTLPLEYEKPNDKAGTIVKFTYDTHAYAVESAAGIELGTIDVEKTANVYLPYGYDPSKQYNVLYLMHGGGEDENMWLYMNHAIYFETDTFSNKRMIDNVFANDGVEPFIIVTPTFYVFAPEDSEYAAYNDAEDIGTHYIRNYRYEMKDLVKAFESQYPTYTNGDVSDENLIATRNHRAYAGLSMGARTSFASIISGCLDFVGYIGSFSGSNVTAGEDNTDLSMEWVDKALNETFPEYDILYWYHGEGTEDFRYAAHKEVYFRMLEEFPDKLKDYENTEIVIKKGFAHDMRNWHIDLFNVLHTFFTKG